MLDYHAQRTLGLSYNYKRKDLEPAFRAMRDIYYPPLHEICGTIDKDRLRQIIYTRQTDTYNFFPCNDPSGETSGKDRSIYAALHFADIYDAYHQLSGDKNYRSYNVSYLDLTEYMYYKYGKAATARRLAAAKFSKKTLWFLIPLAIAWIVALASGNTAIGLVATAIFALLHWGSAFLSMPGYFLLYLPKKLWEGWADGIDYGLLISKLLCLYFFGLFYSIRALAKLIFYPPAVYDDWKWDTFCSKAYKNFCRDLTEKRIKHIESLIAQYGKEFDKRKLQLARIGFRYVRGWKPEAREETLRQVINPVMAQNPHFKMALEENSNDWRITSMCMSDARHTYERRTQLIETLSYEATPIGVYRNDSTADSLHEKNTEALKSTLSSYEMDRVNNQIEKDLIDQRVLLEQCAALTPMMGLID